MSLAKDEDVALATSVSVASSEGLFYILVVSQGAGCELGFDRIL